MSTVYTKLSEDYPFITLCRCGSVEYVGIVQNQDDFITTIYDYGAISDATAKKRFIDLANCWWWESNRTTPINIFLGSDWAEFKPYLRTFNNKDFEILHGPCISLNALAKQKRTRRRQITLVRKVD